MSKVTKVILTFLIVLLVGDIWLIAKKYKEISPCWEYVNKGEYNKAIEYFNTHNSPPEMYLCAGTAYYYLNDHGSALFYLENANPMSPKAIEMIAGIYEEKGDYEKAVVFYRKALRAMKVNRKTVREEFKQKYRETLYHIASLYERLNKKDNAEEYQDCAVRLCKDI